MNLFLDSSVLLAACGSATGASRAVIDAATGQGWQLLSSDYVIGEVEANLAALPAGSADNWARIRHTLQNPRPGEGLVSVIHCARRLAAKLRGVSAAALGPERAHGKWLRPKRAMREIVLRHAAA